MVIITYRKRLKHGLRFGSRVQRDIDGATVLSDVLYRVLSDRKTCIVCGRDLKRVVPTATMDSVEGRNVFHPSCSLNCRRQYAEWLDNDLFC